MDRATLEARLAELEGQYEQARLTAAAIDGAIQQCQWTLEKFGELKAVESEEMESD